MTVGIDCTWNSCAIRGLASTSILARIQVPAPSAASFSRVGDNCLHGPHQSAHRSTTTGTCTDRSTTSDWNVASVTSTTNEPASGAPRDDRGCAPADDSAWFFSVDRSTAPAIEADIAALCRGSGL